METLELQKKFDLLFPIYGKPKNFETEKERKVKNREIAGGFGD